jgi:glyoxylase-like metal-dependent hydrolase (beta-lactamase superfamily II)
MRRALVLLAVLVSGAVSIMIAAPVAQSPGPPMDLERLEDNLYVLHGGCSCGNTTFYLTDAGVVMIDTKVAGQGQAILDQLRSVTDQPIAMIINTHTHFDHTGSNAEFGAVDRIVTHANAKESLMKATCTPATNCDAFKGDNAKYLPNVTFDDTRTLTVGSDQIDLHYFGGGHTDGDAWIELPALRVALTGDMFSHKGVPFIDTANGGTALRFGDTLANATAALTNVDTVITGHFDAFPFNDLVRYTEFHKHLKEYALAGMNAGKPAEEVADAYEPPANLSDFAASGGLLSSFVQLIYDESGTQ